MIAVAAADVRTVAANHQAKIRIWYSAARSSSAHKLSIDKRNLLIIGKHPNIDSVREPSEVLPYQYNCAVIIID